MATRGRKSKELTELIDTGLAVETQVSGRLEAPLHLSDAERSVWAMTVNDQPADAFSPVHIPLLEQYCRHVVQARLMAEQILAFDQLWLAREDGLKRYDLLLKMQEREGRAASSLATRLRITRQATIDPISAGRANARNAKLKPKAPWES